VDAALRSSDRPEDATAVAEICAALPHTIAIYRFGSSVNGTPGPESDLDLAVLPEAPLDPRVRFDLQERLAMALRQPIDLVDLRAASPVMAIQVIANGLLLYDGDSAVRGDFEDAVYGAYARLNEERRGILDRIAAEGTVYGG
jgi:predicted nucleotidyltransferase